MADIRRRAGGGTRGSGKRRTGPRVSGAWHRRTRDVRSAGGRGGSAGGGTFRYAKGRAPCWRAYNGERIAPGFRRGAVAIAAGCAATGPDGGGTSAARSEERRVGKECRRPCRHRLSTYHHKKKKRTHTIIIERTKSTETT